MLVGVVWIVNKIVGAG